MIIFVSRYSDVKVVCGEKSFTCHRFILGTCSDVFDKMFETSGMKEAQSNEIVVEDIDADIMEIFLDLMYSDGTKMEPELSLDQAIGLLEVCVILPREIRL